MDPNAPMDSGDNEDPITKFLKKATEDKEEDEKDEKPPNVIGGGHLLQFQSQKSQQLLNPQLLHQLQALHL